MKKFSVLDLFEMRRPVKTSIKNASSITQIDKTDEEEIKTKERLFIRNSGTFPKARSSKRYKRKNSEVKQQDDNTKVITTEQGDINSSVKNLAKDYESMLKTLQVPGEFRRSQSFIELDQLAKEIRKIEVFHPEIKMGNVTEGIKEERIINNTNPSINTERTKSESGYSMSKAERKERRKNIRSFGEAETEEEKERYRRELIKEMDEQFANMRMDGYIDDTENVINVRIDVPTSKIETQVSNEIHQNDNNHNTYEINEEKLKNTVSNPTYDRILSFEEDFSESLGDDLENGSYFVEAYNDDGRELIIVQISIDRRVVDLNSLQSIKEVMEDSDMVFYENENHTLSSVNDPKEIVRHTEPIYEDLIYEEPPRNDPPLADVQIKGTTCSDIYVSQPSIHKRFTFNSITSTESSYYEDDDISTNDENVYSTSVRRETFCDNQGNIRIERIGYPENNNESSDEAVSSPVSRNNSIAPTKR